MRVLVTADTHIPEWYDSLPSRLLLDAKQSDLILLAGDIVSAEVIDTLESCAPVEAVYGNFCQDELKKRLPTKRILELDGWKVGLTHGHLGTGRNSDEKSLSLFEESLDLVVHGHTHHYHTSKIGDTLIVEPGSPLDTRFTSTRSYALMRLDDEISVDFVILD
jgi:hypothetical protein